MKTLYPHQKKIVETALNRYGIFFRPRVGKTATSIRLASARVKSAIVIVPKSLKEQWEESIEEWNNGNTKFTVITKETFRRDWDKIEKHDAIIWDEVHIGGANYKSQLFKSVEKYIKKYSVQYIWLLTGTPYTSNCWAVYSLGKLLQRDWNWWQWKQRYFIDVRMGPRIVPVQKDKYSNQYSEWMKQEMKTIINSIGVTLSLEDISDQAEDEYVKEYFDLNKEQKKLIEENFDPLPIVRFTKYHQIESGTLKGDGYSEDKFFECEKTKRVLELVEEYKKCAVVGRYNIQLKNYQRLLEEQGRKTFLINGATDNKNEIIKAIEKEEECVVLINSMCSAGYSLKSIDTMIFASLDFSFVNYTQIKDRLKNLKKNKSCTYIFLLTRSNKKHKSVDQAVYDAVMNKKDFDATIFENKD